MEFNYEFDGFILNYEAISKNKDNLAVTRLLATDLMKSDYMSVGTFIQGLSDVDLQVLTENSDDDSETQYQDLILVSEMLAVGEGCAPSETDEEFNNRSETLLKFLILESLHRKGLVSLYHENLSFNDDMGDKIIVERNNT